MICHMCENPTDFVCDRCGNPVCEDCCVQMTIYNQIDYPLCQNCHNYKEAEDRLEEFKKEEKNEEVRKKKDAKNAKARANYWKPENIEKRRKRKEEKRKRDIEYVLNSMKSVMSTLGEMGVSIQMSDLPDPKKKDS